MYTFTNQFNGPCLRQRVGMMNGQRSGSIACWRYGIWFAIMVGMALACRHTQTDAANKTFKPNALPATSPTRASVVKLEDRGIWYKHLALFRTRRGTQVVSGHPVVLQLKNEQFSLTDDHKFEVSVYRNGRKISEEALGKIAPELVDELFVMHQFENLADLEPEPNPYQIFIQTTTRPIPFNGQRKQFFTVLQAASLSKYPFGEHFSFNMNQLLEATFFRNKNALVERTKNGHLSVYDEYANSVEVFINGLPATPAEVKTIHVREVARLHTQERPYIEWFRTDNPAPRFVLTIQTAPKRAKRDSTYYVFSPFYSGDF